MNESWVTMCGMVTVVYNTVLYIIELLRKEILKFLILRLKKNCTMCGDEYYLDLLWLNHAVHLKLIYVNYYPLIFPPPASLPPQKKTP